MTLAMNLTIIFYLWKKNTANKINQPNNNNTYQSNTHIKSSKNSFFLRLIYIKEVLIELQNLDSSKSAPSYNPPVKYFKLASRVIAPILTKLFNISISTSTFSHCPKNF